MDPRLPTNLVQRQLASLIRTDARKADPGALVDRAVEALGPGEHTRNQIVDRAMTDAMATWAVHNPPGGQNGKFLSKREIASIKRADPVLGEVTEKAAMIVRRRRAAAERIEVSVSSPVPGIRLETHGDRYTVHATADVPQGTRFTLTVAGKEMVMMRQARGINELDTLPPEGYSMDTVDRKIGEGDVSITFQIVRDPPGTMTTAQALVLAKEGIVEHLKNSRIHDDDWRDYFPHTWEAALADGIMNSIDAFPGELTSETVGRKPDRFLFVGRGPYDLYTEVEIAKKDGKVLRAYVEID